MLDSWYKADRALIFAHRGASADAPQNTLPAFELAVQQGADGIELDVHRSKDGQAVVIHNFTVDATTNGSGLVAEMTLDQLKTLDAGRWFGEKFRGTPIPTLAEVFAAVGQRLFVNIEIKSKSLETDGVEQVVADLIAQHEMQARVLVSSFNPLTLQRFRAIAPNIPIGFLHGPDLPLDTEALIQQLGIRYEARHPHESQVDAAFMSQAKISGWRVHVWTLNDPERARLMQRLGVDAIITDVPAKLIQALQRP